MAGLGLSGTVCAAALLLGIVGAWVSIPVTPSLLKHHTLLLEALTTSTAAIITGGARASTGHGSLTLVLLATQASLLLYDVFYWWAGRLWGDRLLRFYAAGTPRAARRLSRLEGWVARRGVLVLAVANFQPVPNGVLYALAGASGMSLPLFLLGDAVGTFLWTAFLAGLGWGIGAPALHVVDTIDHYSLRVTIGLVVVVVAVAALRARKGSGGSRPRPTIMGG